MQLGIRLMTSGMMRRWMAALLLLVCGTAAPAQDEQGAILIFSHTSGYRHASIPAGIVAIEAIAGDLGLKVEKSEDPAVFSVEELERFRAIVLLNTTTNPSDPASEWLTGDRRVALQRFVAAGGGIVAVHAAADSHYHWGWYGRLIGGRFARHPPGTPKGKLTVLADPEPNRDLPRSIERADEWYYFDDLDPGSTYLMTLDPGSIGEADANPNPLAWTREVDGGRVFYTAMGHTDESYSEPFFRRHLANGLEWVLSASSPERADEKR
jgi:type 1 glutamine amidotransferase